MLSQSSSILHEFRQASNIPDAFLSQSLVSNKTDRTPKKASLRSVSPDDDQAVLCHALANIFGGGGIQSRRGRFSCLMTHFVFV